MDISLTYTNPVLPQNSPDPGALALPDGSGEKRVWLYSQLSSGYALVTTSNFAHKSEGDPALPLYFSTDLVGTPSSYLQDLLYEIVAGELDSQGPCVSSRRLA